jgi:hypothetical protein
MPWLMFAVALSLCMRIRWTYVLVVHFLLLSNPCLQTIHDLHRVLPSAVQHLQLKHHRKISQEWTNRHCSISLQLPCLQFLGGMEQMTFCLFRESGSKIENIKRRINRKVKEVTVMHSVTPWLWRLASCRTDIVHILQLLAPRFPSALSRCMATVRSKFMSLWNKLGSLLQAGGGGVKAKGGWWKLTSYFIFFTNHFTLTTIRRTYAAVNFVSSSPFVLRRFHSILRVTGFTVHLNVLKQRINLTYSKKTLNSWLYFVFLFSWNTGLSRLLRTALCGSRVVYSLRDFLLHMQILCDIVEVHWKVK